MQIVRGEPGGRVLAWGGGGGDKGGGLGRGWVLALCSVRAQREGKKDFRWEGQDAVQQQMMPAVAQSLVLTR